jgi:hypothetical protein
MSDSTSLKQILEIYYALRAEGVQRFPRPHIRERSKLQNQLQNAAQLPHNAENFKELKSDHSVQENIASRSLFIYDFHPLQLSQNPPPEPIPSILRKLLERLPWREEVVLFSAFDTFPKSPRLDPPDERVVGRLRERLVEGGFGRVVCFGWRCAQILSIAIGHPFGIPPEAFEPIRQSVEGSGSPTLEIDILVLPDVREIEAFLEWRAIVWESLQAFAPPSLG